ncbi:hypothetical protein [Moraxella bovoculi]|uniref:hypothetical protein n=1 Tax=Moraxella bovoculi TaxID=386891 RepID=UPI0009BADE5C|nr:hypothetical protein [Moraxella bovoculi]
MGLEVPKEPENSHAISMIIYVFCMASRARRYIGMTGTPLPLTVKDISDVVDAHPTMIDRETLDAGVFAIDDVWLDEMTRKNLNI